MTIVYTKEEIKELYKKVYGEIYNSSLYENFDQAFDAAWSNWAPSYLTDLTDKMSIIEDICGCSQLSEHL